MDELVGSCVRCAHDVYCTAGFLNGILLDNKKILCFNCKDLLFEAALVGGATMDYLRKTYPFSDLQECTHKSSG
ncbi:hypothetical protein QUF81_19270 [Peribacillus simplex]|uniref:hypothetical protein n=1 Tax=Peribacillus simplex TaxID=1478 RepID=UPI0025A1D4B6|nr:hypothetical protein [Peribacillus simplex]MDM5295265.1 hypothetical protein [Peribacillus simplex]